MNHQAEEVVGIEVDADVALVVLPQYVQRHWCPIAAAAWDLYVMHGPVLVCCTWRAGLRWWNGGDGNAPLRHVPMPADSYDPRLEIWFSFWSDADFAAIVNGRAFDRVGRVFTVGKINGDPPPPEAARARAH